MKHVIKGKPELQYERKQVRGFHQTNKPILVLTLNDGEQRLCRLEIELNTDVITLHGETIWGNTIKEINPNNPKDEELFHLIDEIYTFHGFDIKKDADDEGIIKMIYTHAIENYFNSLAELELEIQQINDGFEYKIINLNETDINFKESLAKLIIGQRAII